MNILVTGGAGFIASHIVDAYIEQGHKVTVLDNLSSGKKAHLNPKAAFYHMDLLDPDVKKIFAKEKIQIINHHAAQVSVNKSVTDPVFDANSNIIGTLQLLQNAVSFGVGKIIFASTGGALYGDNCPLPADENSPCRPASPYGISKLSIERYLDFYKNEFKLDYAVLRYSNVFGPRQDPFGESGVVAIFCNLLKQGRPPVIFGDGEQTRDFISVWDVVQANLLALKPECSGVFNVGTAKEISINVLTEHLIRISGNNVRKEYQPPRKGEQRRSAIDYRKFHENMGWNPKKTLESGLLETFKYFASDFR